MTGPATISRRAMLKARHRQLLGAPRILRSAAAQRRAKTVYVNSYGGVWESSWRKAFFDPFTAQTGIEIKTVPGVLFAKLKAEVQTGNYEYDQCNLGDSELRRPSRRGCLSGRQGAAKPLNCRRARCASSASSAIRSAPTSFIVRTGFRMAGRRTGPISGTSKKFPGPRCLFDRSFTCLAFALLADGVPRTSSIRWMSTAPSARWMRSSRT